MPYFVSFETMPDALKTAGWRTIYPYFKQAEMVAQIIADETNRPHYVYQITQTKKFDPTPKPNRYWNLEYAKVERMETVIAAPNLAEAIAKSRESFPKEDWDLICSYETNKPKED